MLHQFCQNLALSLKSETGAINTAGAMIGIVATAAVGGVAATSAGNAIPMAHDMAARQNASQIGTAQGLALVIDGDYTDLVGLEASGYMPAHRATTGPRRFATQAGAGGTCFVTVSRSATGSFFFATDLIPTSELLVPGASTGCLPDGQVQDMARSLDVAAAGH